MITPDTTKAIRIEVVRILDALFLEIAETEQDHDQDQFVEVLWKAFADGELRLINNIIEPVNAPNERRTVATENAAVVAARQAVLAAA
jgi:hypothetical protein